MSYLAKIVENIGLPPAAFAAAKLSNLTVECVKADQDRYGGGGFSLSVQIALVYGAHERVSYHINLPEYMVTNLLTSHILCLMGSAGLLPAEWAGTMEKEIEEFKLAVKALPVNTAQPTPAQEVAPQALPLDGGLRPRPRARPTATPGLREQQTRQTRLVYAPMPVRAGGTIATTPYAPFYLNTEPPFNEPQLTGGPITYQTLRDAYNTVTTLGTPEAVPEPQGEDNNANQNNQNV